MIWAKGSCYRDADHVNPFSLCKCLPVHDVKILSVEGNYTLQPGGVKCQVVICMQMTE